MGLHGVSIFLPCFPKKLKFKFEWELEYFQKIFDSRSSKKTLSKYLKIPYKDSLKLYWMKERFH